MVATPKKKRRLKTPPHKMVDGECTIPGAIPVEAMRQFIVKPGGEDADNIRSYIEWQAPDEKVTHLEKVSSENVFGQPMTAWDVRTNKNRWWVITNPTNLYSQDLFPSLDYTLSFHVGVTTRMMQSEMSEEQEEMHDSINDLWNRLARARSACFEAQKPEEFQSVGMKCRECLLLLVQKLGSVEMIPEKQTPPQRANFKDWCELISNFVARGSSKERVRSHLKSVAASTWELTNWLTHTTKAEKHDAILAVEATEHVLTVYVNSWARNKGGKLRG